jgi:transketolase
MRTAFIEELIAQARLRADIFLVVGDLGYSVVEPFAAEFPDRYLNAGVAEQNMTGVAAGLAAEGYHVFTYSIANFPTLRCLEQIRNDVCYHLLPVTVVAIGGGLAYGNLGYSHHGVQDIAVMRTLPNITVLAPGDPGETRAAVQWLADNPCPSYLRVGKAGEKVLHSVDGLGGARPLMIRTGAVDVAIVSTGGILEETVRAAELLAEDGRRVPVFSMPWLKPIDAAACQPLNRYRQIIAVEEHIREGGLASILQENLLGQTVVTSLSVSEAGCDEVGTQVALRRHFGLNAASIRQRCLELLSPAARD